MQYSIVQYSKVRELEDFRIDADYFHPDYLQKERIIVSQKCAPLETLSLKVSDFGAYSQTNIVEYKESGKYIFIRNKDVRGFFLDRMDRVYVDEDVYNQLSLHLEKHDIVIQRTGTLGKAGILMDEDLPSTANQNLAQIRVNKERISPFYLLAFLNSDFGISVFERLKTGNVQPWLNLKQIKTLTIPILTTRFQEIIETIVFSAYENEVRSGNSYQEAEQILLSELGLQDWKPQHQLSFTKHFSDTQLSDRIDAEYFQPQYDEIIKAVKSAKNYASLDDLVSIKKCVEPGSEAYQTSGVPFVRVSNLSKFGINADNQQFISESLYESLKMHQPQKGEILLSKDATPGIAYYLSHIPGKMIPSSGILRLTVKDAAKIIPEYLTLVLNSVIVQKQIERDVGGSVINHWLVDQVKNTIVPLLDDAVQKEISGKIAESFLKRTQSRSLLEIAKVGVEMAIEKSEAEALKWINQEVKSHA